MRRLTYVGAWGAFALTLLLFPLIFSPAALADKRVALVIGNGAYQHAPMLTNPTRDARAIGEMFEKAGFQTVQVRNDVGNLDFKRALREFFDVAKSADIAVVFFAGHGIQIADQNYMIPVDAKLAREYDAKDEAISLERIVEAIEPAVRLRLVILDACRDNPFLARMQRRVATRGVASGGLARVEPTFTDTLIAYAAKAGSTADDGDSNHSPFTTALLKHIAEPGLDIRLAFGRVRDEVRKVTRDEQEPFVYGSLGGTNISLVPPPAVPKPAALSEVKGDYELVERINSKKAWEVFVNHHKEGMYVDLARERLRMLDSGQASPAPERKDPRVAALPPPSTPAGPTKEENSAWDRVKESQDPAAIRRFLERNKSSPHALAATSLLESLEKAAREKEEKAAAEEARKKAEAKRLAEEKAAAEAKRLADQKAAAEAERVRKAEEARKQAEAKRLVEEKAAAEAKRVAEEKAAAEAERMRKAEDARKQAEASRLAEERVAAEAKRLIEETRKKVEARKLAEEKAAAEAKRLVEETKKQAEAKRLAEEKAAAEAKRLVEEKSATDAERMKKAEEARKQAEAKRLAEEKAAAEAKRVAEEKAAAEAERVRKAEEAKKQAEAKRLAEEKAAAEAKRLAAEKAAADAERVRKAEEAKKQAEAKRLAEEKAAAEAKKLAAEKAEAERLRKAEAKSLADEKAAAEAKTVRLAQLELRRVGCFSGRDDGLLNQATKDAIELYHSKLGKRSIKLDITDEFIAELKRQPRVCPLVCREDQVAQGDQCIAKATPEKEKPAQKRPAKEEPRQASKPQRRDDDAPSRARQREARPVIRSGGGSTMTGVGF